MPPRFAFWTIILDGVPTSFRAREKDEILPTFNQLKKKNPGAQLKWFSGGRLFDSPEQAREERQLERVREFRAARSKEEREERAREMQALAEFRVQRGRPADGSDQRVRSAPSSESERRERGAARGPGKRGPDRKRSADEDRGERAFHKPGKERQRGPGAAPGAKPHGDHKAPPGQRARNEDPLAEFRRQHGRPADGSDQQPPRGPAAHAAPKPQRDRGRDWRPGGDHKDPRDKYKLPPGEARKRWKKRHLGHASNRQQQGGSFDSTKPHDVKSGRPHAGPHRGPDRGARRGPDRDTHRSGRKR